MSLRGVRIAPRDREDLLLLAEQPLGHAPSGRDVKDVVLVDRRRHEQQRHLIDLLGGRPVLDQLEHIGPQHHRSGRDGEISSDLELAHVDAGRQVRRARDVVEEATAAADEVGASCVDALLEHGGIGPGEVRRRQCVEHVARGKARLPLGPPIELGIGDQPVDRVAGGEVCLHHAMKEPVVSPRPVAKPAIALGRTSARAPGRHARELYAEAG